MKQVFFSGHISHFGALGVQTAAHKSSKAKLNALDLPGGIISAANFDRAVLRAGLAGIGEANPKKRCRNRAIFVSTTGILAPNAKLRTARAV